MDTVITLRPLGRSNLMVSPIGLGCWQFSKQKNFAGKFWTLMEDDLIGKVVSQSLAGGIDWFDTAEMYGNGASEKALAAALLKAGKKPGDVLVATKWWPFLRSAANIGKTIDTRLKALEPYPIDLYQVHQPWGFSNEKDEMEAMAVLVKAGKVRHVGVSNFSAARMRSAWETLQKHGIQLVSNQVRYSLLDRSIESNGILDTAKELGISIIAYSPLAQGVVTGKFHDDPALLTNTGLRRFTPQFRLAGLKKSLPLVMLIRQIAEDYHVTPSQVALNWLIHFNSNMVVAIPGATKEVHVKENTGAMSFRLSDEDMMRLDAESAIYK